MAAVPTGFHTQRWADAFRASARIVLGPDAEVMPSFVAPLVAGRADFAKGNRFAVMVRGERKDVGGEVTLTAFDVMPFTCTQIVAGPFTPEGFTTSNFVETVFVPVATPIVLKLCVGW